MSNKVPVDLTVALEHTGTTLMSVGPFDLELVWLKMFEATI